MKIGDKVKCLITCAGNEFDFNVYGGPNGDGIYEINERTINYIESLCRAGMVTPLEKKSTPETPTSGITGSSKPSGDQEDSGLSGNLVSDGNPTSGGSSANPDVLALPETGAKSRAKSRFSRRGVQ
jgi:hypothetical protein